GYGGRAGARTSTARGPSRSVPAAGPCDLDRLAAALSSSGRKIMIRWFLRRQITAFEQTWNYDSSYIREVLDADPRALWAFSKVMGFSRYRKDVPLAVYYAAKITGTMAEDCGPCTQLAIDMAVRAGVSAAEVQAIVSG